MSAPAIHTLSQGNPVAGTGNDSRLTAASYVETSAENGSLCTMQSDPNRALLPAAKRGSSARDATDSNQVVTKLAAQELVPDFDEASRFLKRLDPQKQDAFAFQTFDQRKYTGPGTSGPLAKWFHGTLDQHFEALAKLHQEGAGVLLMVNEQSGRRHSDQSVIRIRANFIVLKDRPLAPVLECGAEPHIVVSSGPGEWQIYWLATDDYARCSFEDAQRDLACHLHGASYIIERARTMRLPGFFHRVDGIPFMTRVYDWERRTKTAFERRDPNAPYGPYELTAKVTGHPYSLARWHRERRLALLQARPDLNRPPPAPPQGRKK